MISPGFARNALVVVFATMVAGCFQAGSSFEDEEKEAHFQTGRARVNGMDYGGAVEAFNKALEVNPHSAPAHFELGWLYADKQPDPAAAIYHYERFLALRPKAENAETIKLHIFRLKQKLAEAVLPLPATPGVQRQLEELMDKNRQLQEEVDKCRAYYANRTAPATTNLPAGSPGSRTPPASGGKPSLGGPSPQQISPDNRRSTSLGVGNASSVRSHKVQAGETPLAIAKKYGIKLEALLAANPDLKPNRMQVGQMLAIPAS